MVVERINEVKDASGRIRISVFRDSQLPGPDPTRDHHDFQVDVEPGWVCIGGGGKGKPRIVVPGVDGAYGALYPPNYLTGSFPSVDADGKHDFKGWRVKSKDHLDLSKITLTVYAIGMIVDGLNKDALIANLKVFRGVGIPVQHPDFRQYLDQGYLLLGGGFHAVTQTEGGGNIGTGSFADSTISWRGRSQDILVSTDSELDVFAIGIRSILTIPDPTKDDPSHMKNWEIITSYSSFEFLNKTQASPGSVNPDSVAKPLPGFALCGGGGVTHAGSVGGYLWCLEPTPLDHPLPADGSPRPVRILEPHEQTFTTKSTSYNENHTNTSYAMGIKIQPSLTIPPPLQPCDNPVTVSTADSTGSESPFEPTNAIDGKPDTKWVSTDIQNPYIRLVLSDERRICRVDITWAEPDKRYFFTIATSVDGNEFTYVFAGARIGSTITSPETYTFPEAHAKFVKITIIQSTPGAATSKVEISEIAVFTSL